MKIKPTSDELTELFVRGFELADSKKRGELLDRVEHQLQCKQNECQSLHAFLASETSTVFTKVEDDIEYVLCSDYVGDEQVAVAGLFWRIDAIVAGKVLRCVMYTVPSLDQIFFSLKYFRKLILRKPYDC